MHITLFNNPVCQIPGYRHFIVNSIPCLKALDNFVITDEERIEDASFGYRFRGLNEFMKLHIPDYRHERSAENHLFNLEVDRVGEFTPMLNRVKQVVHMVQLF